MTDLHGSRSVLEEREETRRPDLKVAFESLRLSSSVNREGRLAICRRALESLPRRTTHSDNAQDMCVNVQRSLMNSTWKGGSETLSQSFGDDELLWNLGEGRIQLKSLIAM